MSIFKILHLSKYYSPKKGGIESAVKSIAEYSSKKFTHTVLTNSFKNKIRLENNVNIIDRNFFKIFRQTISYSYCLWYVLNRKNFSIVHLHLPNYISARIV